MYTTLRTILTSLFLLGGLMLTPAAHAIEVAVPSQMFTWTISGNGDNGDGYYYLDPFSRALNPLEERGYSLILDTDGEIVWYRIMGLNSPMYSHIRRWDDGVFTGSLGVNPPSQTHVFDQDGTLIDFLPAHHPLLDAERDSHEIIRTDDGLYWTLWLEYHIVDMSDYGGYPDAEVGFHIIELWDEDHNTLWSWNSYDHQDALPIDQRTEVNDLTEPDFEHIHLNAFDILPDGDILCSARQMSVIFRIDRETGEVEWCFGGGPLNEFTITPSPEIGDDIPLEFYAQHDVRYTPDGRFSMFDNGFRHDIPCSYAREYVLDEENRTAELAWAYQNDQNTAAFITGSFRRLPDGNRLIGWGNMYPTVNATELDPEDNVVWQLEFETDDVLGAQPGIYRIFKSDEFNPDPQPYICVESRPAPQRDRIYCNWFGHEDEVSAYEIEAGLTLDTFYPVTTTETGIVLAPPVDSDSTIYLRARALDSGGEPISPWSNVWTLRETPYTFDLRPKLDHVPPTGGAVVFNVRYEFPYPIEIPGVTFWTEALAPNGQVFGPLYEIGFDINGPQSGTYSGAFQQVPSFAPPGIYQFTAKLGYPNQMYLTDTFLIYKKQTGSTAVGDPPDSDWGSSLGDKEPDENAARPSSIELSPASPNPFNPTTRLTLTLRQTSRVRVTVHNTLGQQVGLLRDEFLAAGEHGLDLDGRDWASGIYFVRVQTDHGATAMRKVALVR